MRLLVLATLTAFLAFPLGAWARCPRVSGPLAESDLRSVDLIVFGRVVHVEQVPSAPHERFADILVQARWQGESLERVRVWPPDSVHGPRFVAGSEFLVFANRVGDRYEASMCLPSCTGSNCLYQLKLLGDPVERFDTG